MNIAETINKTGLGIASFCSAPPAESKYPMGYPIWVLQLGRFPCKLYWSGLTKIVSARLLHNDPVQHDQNKTI